MSKSPQQSEKTPQSRDEPAEAGAAGPGSAEPGSAERLPEPAAAAAPTPAALIFDDPMSLQSSDDTDRGWGEGSSGKGAGNSAAADLARFLDEKPPHHI